MRYTHTGDDGIGSDDLPFDTENDAERRIVSDDEWRRGAAWGIPRAGHPAVGASSAATIVGVMSINAAGIRTA